MATCRALVMCWIVWLPLLSPCASSTPEQLILTCNLDPGPWPAGGTVQLWLNALNVSAEEVSWEFPNSVPCQLKTPGGRVGGRLERASSATPQPVTIAPGAFARERYRLELPSRETGQFVIEFTDTQINSLVLLAQPSSAAAPPSGLKKALEGGNPPPADEPFDPARFFKDHLGPYEPIYFIAGPESPNAKFQFSFRYQLLRNEAPLADSAPLLTGFQFAYTQTSLWDWSTASAPFLDTSYKPELHFLWKGAYEDRENGRFRLDLQPGFQHESNGKGEPDSRSLNLVYLRPTLVFGRQENLQFTLQPRAWFYVGDLSDNQDIARYRGYADLRAILGWQRGAQLSAIGRLGDHADKGSLQLDFTYPMLRIWSSFSVYFDLQYFTGYGESLLLYDERSWAVRAGFSLYR